MLWLALAALTTSALTGTAHADAFRLANGSTIEGTLATYELGGNCQIFVSTGPVRGATLLLPCEEILAFARPGAEPPVTAVEPAAVTPVAAVPVAAVPVAAVPVAAVPVAAVPQPNATPEPAAAEPAAPQPVAASLPDGYLLPGDEALAEAQPEPPPEPTVAPAPANVRATPRPTPTMEPSEDVDQPAPAQDAATPSGWHEKGAKAQKQMPRWLYRTIYGEEPPDTTTDGVSSGSGSSDSDSSGGSDS